MTPKLSFSDEDLKRLKEDLCLFHTPENRVDAEDIKSLLHRLECAEDLVLHSDLFDSEERRFNKWLKASGKSKDGG